MRFALDADGVIFDFEKTWIQIAEKVLNRELTQISDDFYIEARYGLTKEELNKCWTTFNLLEGWGRCLLLTGSKEIINLLLDMGHDVYVVSKLERDDARELRQRQFSYLFNNRVSVNFTNDSKEELLANIKPDFFADDNWSHCLEAKNAKVPYIAKIDGNHKGNDGTKPIPGVNEYSDLSTAIRAYFNSFKNISVIHH